MAEEKKKQPTEKKPVKKTVKNETKTKKDIAVKPTSKSSAKKTVKSTPIDLKGKLSKNLKKGMEVLVIKGKFKGQKGEIVRYEKSKQMVFIKDFNTKVDYGDKLMNAAREKGLKLAGLNISKIKLV